MTVQQEDIAKRAADLVQPFRKRSGLARAVLEGVSLACDFITPLAPGNPAAVALAAACKVAQRAARRR